jgi:hypothetical protein
LTARAVETECLIQVEDLYQGRTPDPNASDPIIRATNFTRARIVTDGGFSKYRALNVKLRGRFGELLPGNIAADGNSLTRRAIPLEPTA